MPTSIKSLISFLIIVLIALWAMLPARFEVLGPRLGVPAIVRSGDALQVSIHTSIPLWRPHWQVWLEHRGKRVAIKDVLHKARFNTATLSFSVPATLNAGSYSLVVSDGSQEQRRPDAIHIVSHFPDAVSIVQLADLPTLGNHDGDRRMQQLVDEINIINPDLVLMTGDVAYGGQWQQYRLLLAAMARINAPVIAAPGNHEYEGWAAYLTLLGTPYHRVSYGKLQIISLNSGHGRDQLTETQYAWLQDVFRHLDGRTPLVQLHHPVQHRAGLHGFVANHVQDMVEMFRASAVPIVLSGHWHGDAVYDETGQDRRDTWNFPGVPYVTTTTAGADLREDYASSPVHHGYRLIRLDHGKLVSYTYDMDGDGRRDATSSIPVGKLHSTQQDATGVKVINDLNEDFDSARVMIKVPGNQKDLRPDQGRLVEQYQQDDASVYVIEMPLPAQSQQEVHLLNPLHKKEQPQ
jgi:hypothetical protein